MLDLSTSPDERIVTFVKDWLKMLSEGRLEEACDLLDKPDRHGRVWTPKAIKQEVAETFSPDTRFYLFHPEGPIFTDPYELEPQTNRKEIGEFSDKNGYWFDCDMPLNHEWSDLTAQFEFYKTPDGYASVLADLHVL